MSQQTRQTIMTALIDFETILCSREIILMNSHPRDVILTDRVQGNDIIIMNYLPRLVFNLTYVTWEIEQENIFS